MNLRSPVLAITLSALSACAAVHRPLATRLYPGRDPTTAVVLLPGLLADEGSFERHGFVDAVRDAGIEADLVGVGATLGAYRDRRLLERLRAEVLPDLRRRYDHVSVLGISLGGFGAIESAVADPTAFDEVVALSPFLGRRAVMDAIQLAGGLERWHPAADAGWDHDVWTSLQRCAGRREALAPVWLGYGRRDAIVGSPRLLADMLPRTQVAVVRGGHGWGTWRRLVGELAARGALRPSPPAEDPVAAVPSG